MAFAFVTPNPDDTIEMDDNGKILVQISDTNHGRYRATIIDFDPAPGAGIGADISLDILNQEDGTDLFSNKLTVDVTSDPPEGENNRVVRVEDRDTGDIEGHAFRAVLPGSGSGSKMFLASARERQRCPNCSPDRPVPVEVLLTLDTKVAAGTCAKCSRLNEPTLLRHSDDAEYPCCWFSESIDFCSKGKPGIWMLEKSDPSTWTLTLKRGKTVIVTYGLTTKAKKDCKLPRTLSLVGKGGKECKRWPKTVTVAPAP